MYKLSKSRVILILTICLIGIFFALPNLFKDSSKLPSWWQPVNLGLDLQGGSSLLMQVEVDEAIKERLGNVEDAARQILRENKIRYTNLKNGADGVHVKIENALSRDKAANLFRKIDDGIEVKDAEDGQTLIINYSEVALNQLKHKKQTRQPETASLLIQN